ncbi:hypothetical protein OG562_45905, partial [Streptomyces sp. NBC_01275]|uniref:hypothetical protein n=1 Tax=Streptomyces sp. NBC_01275 TaxID=2903807 RepID=UPI00225B79F9
APVDWTPLTTAGPHRLTDLPTYPFQHRHLWIEDLGADDTPVDERRGGSGVDGWRYGVAWRPVAGSGAERPAGTWWIVVPERHEGHAEDPWATAVTRTLAECGARAVVVELSAADTDRAALTERLRALAAEGSEAGPAGVLSFLARDARRGAGRRVLTTGVALTLTLTQALHDLGLRAP